MTINFPFTKHLVVSIFVMLLIGSCSKNNIYIDIINPDGTDNNEGTDNDGNNSNPSKESTLITFSVSIEGRNMTRSMSPMSKGLESWLCAYKANTRDTINGEPVEEGDYVTSSPGVLAGIKGYKMYLENDIYSFYGVSCNSKNRAPFFTKGISEPLSNGIDYLWWSALHQDVTSSQINIPITFQHAATQVVVVINAGEDITLNKIVSATITPTKPGAIMDLSTGLISSETGYDTPTAMGINGFTIQYIMLPLKSSSPMTLTMDLLVNGEETPRSYTTPLVPPNNNLAGGNSYLFRAIINENTIEFANVSIQEWTNVDESGKPLYPTQN